MSNIEQLNNMSMRDAYDWFMQTCTATRWCQLMSQSRPYGSIEQLIECAKQQWSKMQSTDYLEAFDGHPMIGDINSLREKYAATKALAGNEQSGTAVASDAVLKALQKANADYLDKHGFIFIICASGLSAETMLTALNDRVVNTTSDEEINAAKEQLKITLLRINKALDSSAASLNKTKGTSMNSLSSHVLDTTSGKPASKMKITLITSSSGQVESETDADGRCKDWGETIFTAGIYCLRFHCKEYLEATHGESFYPFVDINFEIKENGGHYHVPLLISPYGYNSYRGS